MAYRLTNIEDMCVSIDTYEMDGKTKDVLKQVGQIKTFESDDGAKFKTVDIFAMPGAKVKVFKSKKFADSQNGGF